jgi:HrpA-like RNA helicase
MLLSCRQHTDPEIANTPLEGVVLLLKAMGVDKVHTICSSHTCKLHLVTHTLLRGVSGAAFAHQDSTAQSSVHCYQQ